MTTRSTQKVQPPLTVWLCGDDRHTEKGCARHGEPIGTALAAKLVEGFTQPGELVADLTATSHVVSEAAAVHGRRALTVTPDGATFRAVSSALKETLTRPQSESVDMVIQRREWPPSDLLPTGQFADVAVAALGTELFTAAQPYSSGPPRRPGELLRILETAERVLRTAGILLTVTAPGRDDDQRLIDPIPDITERLSGRFGYLQHVIAVRAPVQGRQILIRLHPGCDSCQAEAVSGTARAHVDVCAFTRL